MLKIDHSVFKREKSEEQSKKQMLEGPLIERPAEPPVNDGAGRLCLDAH